MILIFEGPDNGGKSTVCKLLEEQYEFNFDKFIRHHNPAEMVERVLDTLTAPEKRGWTQGTTILDRWHYPSDVVNEPIYTGNQSALQPLRSTIEERLLELDTHLVYLTAPIDIIEERYNRRGDEFVGFEQIRRVHRLYEDFMDTTTLPVFQIDTSAFSPEDCVALIASEYNLRRKVK